MGSKPSGSDRVIHDPSQSTQCFRHTGGRCVIWLAVELKYQQPCETETESWFASLKERGPYYEQRALTERLQRMCVLCTGLAACHAQFVNRSSAILMSEWTHLLISLRLQSTTAHRGWLSEITVQYFIFITAAAERCYLLHSCNLHQVWHLHFEQGARWTLGEYTTQSSPSPSPAGLHTAFWAGEGFGGESTRERERARKRKKEIGSENVKNESAIVWALWREWAGRG